MRRNDRFLQNFEFSHINWHIFMFLCLLMDSPSSKTPIKPISMIYHEEWIFLSTVYELLKFPHVGLQTRICNHKSGQSKKRAMRACITLCFSVHKLNYLSKTVAHTLALFALFLQIKLLSAPGRRKNSKISLFGAIDKEEWCDFE